VAFSASWLLAQSLWHMSVTWQWNGFVGVWRGMLAMQQGPLQLDKTPFAKPSLAGQCLRFDWDWANPYLSIMLAPDGQVRSIVRPRNNYSWALDPLDPLSLPHLEKFGVDYSLYANTIRKQMKVVDGLGIPREMFESYQSKADAGDGFAQLRLGEIYLRGDRTQTNTDLARRWLSAAVTNGYPQATNHLSEIEGRSNSK
jgi:hypothetical protein